MRERKKGKREKRFCERRKEKKEEEDEVLSILILVYLVLPTELPMKY
jgi:hypothetical protein